MNIQNWYENKLLVLLLESHYLFDDLWLEKLQQVFDDFMFWKHI